MSVTDEQLIGVDGAELCVQAFGAAADPTVLLIGGMASSMDWWDDDWCAQLAATGRRVVRYDHRDTGRSTSWPVGSPGYTFTDLVEDPVALLDAFGIDRAHLVGLSMGGGIAQCVAMDRPERVASLTVMSTGAVAPIDRELPAMSEELSAFEAARVEPDWDDRAAVIDHLLAEQRAYTGTLPFDEDRLRALLGRVLDRTTDVRASQVNHGALPDDEASDAPPRRMTAITAPTLVLHGTADPLFAYPHAEALAEAITGARLVPLVGVGHEYPPSAVWDEVIDAIATHTA